MTEKGLIDQIRVQLLWYRDWEPGDMHTREERAKKIEVLEQFLVDKYGWTWDQIEDFEIKVFKDKEIT